MVIRLDIHTSGLREDFLLFQGSTAIILPESSETLNYTEKNRSQLNINQTGTDERNVFLGQHTIAIKLLFTKLHTRQVLLSIVSLLFYYFMTFITCDD